MIATDVKMALINYTEFKRCIKRDTERIEEINVKRFKIGGSVIKLPENSTKQRSTIIIENLEKHDLANLSLINHQYLVYIADQFMNSVNGEWKEIIIDRYIKHLSQQQLVDKYCYPIRYINRRINKLIDCYIKVT